ncbi:arabinogalactan O-methyltransferase 2-like [Rutidosis leptorrhynchoides]|uniref:arabinogalactan O-methyltransferase 2-like n=1 Tax=Rutidosis leptorrhynchoides TaxID=125765 RepID=UPI003A99D8FF
MPPQEPSSSQTNAPLLRILSPKTSLIQTTRERSSLTMNLTKRKLILLLVFILVAASLLRVLRITISTSYLPSLEHVQNAKNPSHTTKILSDKELNFLSDIILEKSPCNILVFGLEEQLYLKLPSINKGGTTIFLEDNQEKLDKMNANVEGTRFYKIKYKTSAKEAYELFKHARTHSSCSFRSGVRSLASKCKIALTGLPNEVLKTKWDVIVVDGPGGDGPESPGRMGAIYMAGVLARAGNGTNVVVHDVDRTIEKWFSWEFLSEKNLVSSKGKFWNFRIAKKKKLISLKPSV